MPQRRTSISDLALAGLGVRQVDDLELRAFASDRLHRGELTAAIRRFAARARARASRSGGRAARRRRRPRPRRRSSPSSGCASGGRSSSGRRSSRRSRARRGIRGSRPGSSTHAARTGSSVSGCSIITLMNAQPSKSVAPKPAVEDLEDREQAPVGIVGATLDLGLQPAARPQLLTPLEHREHQLLLRAKAPVERLPRHAGGGDDLVDADDVHAAGAEELVGGIEDPLAGVRGTGWARLSKGLSRLHHWVHSSRSPGLRRGFWGAPPPRAQPTPS